MILRQRPSALRLFFVLRGSILTRIRGVLLANVLLAVVVTLGHRALPRETTMLMLSPIPFSLMGLPLAVFLGFRNSSCYDRYWEARKLWGELVQRSRNLARQALHLVDWPEPPADARDLGDVRVRLLLRTAAFCHALKALLRGRPDDSGLQGLVEPAELAALAMQHNRPAALMLSQGADLARCRRDGLMDSVRAVEIDATLSAMTAAAAGCERIRNTPLPFSYSLLLHRTAYLYCFLLPFGLVDAIGLMTPLVVAIVAYTFFGLDALGDEIEEPFGTEANDLPLDALCRGIEIELRQALGDPAPPPPLQPVDYLLL